MNSRQKMLDRIMALRLVSPNHFYSPNADTYDGSVLTPGKYFKEFLKRGYIKKVDFDEQIDKPRRKQLYTITFDGAKYIEAEKLYTPLEYRAARLIKHESMIRDVVQGFFRAFPAATLEVEYSPKRIAKNQTYRPDIFIKLYLPEQKKSFWYFIELERKDGIAASIIDKVNSFRLYMEALKSHTTPALWAKIPAGKVKCLIVSNLRHNDAFLRPMEYKDHQQEIFSVDNCIKIFLEKSGHRLQGEFQSQVLLMNFYDFHRLNEPVFFDFLGCKRKLI